MRSSVQGELAAKDLELKAGEMQFMANWVRSHFGSSRLCLACGSAVLRRGRAAWARPVLAQLAPALRVGAACVRPSSRSVGLRTASRGARGAATTKRWAAPSRSTLRGVLRQLRALPPLERAERLRWLLRHWPCLGVLCLRCLLATGDLPDSLHNLARSRLLLPEWFSRPGDRGP